MNCKRVQKKINRALASSESIPGELEQHLLDCPHCCAFFASQTSLFGSIDSQLRRIANEPAPRSLLPGVRARLQVASSPRPQWMSTWGFAAITVLMILTSAVSVPMRRRTASELKTGIAGPMASSASSANRSPVADHHALVTAPQPGRARVTARARVASAASTQEVLVLREEQGAYAHFVNQLSRDRDSAIVLTTVAPAIDDAPVEIALLTIESVEVKPLESSDSE